MADKISEVARSRNMSHIKGKDTGIEIKVRHYLFHHGFRYRKNVKELPGKPDIVLPKYKTVIFVNGCFWHHHENCKLAVYPKSNVLFWKTKIDRTVVKDKENYHALRVLGYKVLVVWECEVKAAFEFRMKQLIEEIIYDTYD